MNFIKNHWFGLIVSLITLAFLCVFALVLIAPHQDEQGRGFVPCIEKMAENLHECRGQNLCALNCVIENTFCNIKVIGQGIKQWAAGEQPRPWSNYLFEPELKQPSAADDFETEESLDEYYQNNPDISLEMSELYKLNQQLEQDTNEQ